MSFLVIIYLSVVSPSLVMRQFLMPGLEGWGRHFHKGKSTLCFQAVKQSSIELFLNLLILNCLTGGSKGKAMQETQVQSLSQGRSPGKGNGNPFQYSCLENPMDRGSWWVTVHGVIKSQTGLSDSHFHFQNNPYDKLAHFGVAYVVPFSIIN